MAKLLTTGGGTQLVTGGGVALSADAKIVSVGVAAMVLAFGLAASPTAHATPSVSPLVVEFGLTAQPSSSGGVEPITIEFGLSASPTADAYATTEPAGIAWTLDAQAHATATASAAPIPVVFSLDASATAVAVTSATVGPMGLGFTLSAQPSVPVSAGVEPLSVSFGLSGNPSVSRSEYWLSLWENAYAKRQEVLNAIDANNRFLAKDAGTKATATANALVVTNTNVTNLDGRLTAEAERVTAIRAAIDNPEYGLLATSSGVNTLRTTVESHGTTLTAQGQQITAVQGQIGGKADASAVNALTGRVEQNEQGLVAQSEILSQVRSEARDPFTSGFGWEFTSNHRGFTTDGAILDQWPATSNDGASVVQALGNDPQFISPVFAVSGNANPVVRAMVRRRDSVAWDGRMFWSNSNHEFSAAHAAGVSPPPPNEWTILEWDLRNSADFRSGTINRLRFDFGAAAGSLIDVKWIALGNYGAGRAAQVTQNMQTTVDTASNIARAVHGVVLTVDGKISGTRSENDGTQSRFDVLADVFRVTGSPVEGMEWQAGYLRVYGPAYQRIIGTNFGAASEGLVDYFGPNVGAANATRANGLFWLAKDGTGYFAGEVLQGVLRAFNSSTAVGSTIVATPVSGSKNKIVALQGRFEHSGFQGFTGQVNLTPGGGGTYAVVALERQYIGEGWVTLAERTVTGGMSTVNGTDGDGSVSWDISGQISATDVASTKQRAYRIRVISVARQGFIATGGGAPQGQTQLTQYQSIESLE